VFKSARAYLLDELNIEYEKDIWEKVGPYTCNLNVDENDDVDATWK